MGRSVKKGPYVDAKLFKKVEKQKDTGDREPIRTWARSCTIVPEFVSHSFNVHNGRTFMRVFVTEEMVGHKLGEFAPTRIFRGHSGRKAREAAAAAAAGAPPPAART
jgi:small subunit ribosomal protein S19